MKNKNEIKLYRYLLTKTSLMKYTFLIIIFIVLTVDLHPQQIADTTYHPAISSPAYDPGIGPVVFIDEGHYNFHTKDGRYKAFSLLLERDGYVVQAYKDEFQSGQLAKGKILVISNALNEMNVEHWYLPNPSAFTKTEIRELKKWIRKGGNLFLIADHMPMAGAARDLGDAFGFTFTNGFVLDTISGGPAYFSRDRGTLIENVISNGRDPEESVNQIATFTGQAFKIPKKATPILQFGDGFLNFLPDTAWVFSDKTPIYDVTGWYQGAYRKFGRGRVVVFGEAAMFTAQLAGPQRARAGMNHESAPENYQLLLNIIHWLDGKLD